MSTKEDLLYSDKNIDTQYFSCPNCGGKTKFNPSLQKVECEYCGTTFDVDKSVNVTERSIDELLAKGTSWTGTEVIKCPTCGAKEIVSKSDIAKACPFCGTTNIVKTEELAGLKPQGVCPFEVPQENASGIARKWVKKKLFAPNAFKRSAEAKNIHGVYSPAFTFDSQTTSKYDGILGVHEQRTRPGPNGTVETYTVLRTFHIAGTHDANFDDMIVQASTNIPFNVLNKIEPFPTNDAPAYNQGFLRGYSANTYSKDGQFCWNECKMKMDSAIRSQILSKYFHDTVESFQLNTTHKKSSYKYLLLPIYIGHHNFKEKLYNFYINGSTGKIWGKSPVSFWKVSLAVLLGLGVAALIGLGIYFFKK